MSHTTPDADRDGGQRVSPTAPRPKSLSAAIWDHLEREPGFNEAIAEGQRQIAEGRSVKFREIRRSR